MTQREKLVEMIQNSVGGCARNWAEVIADHLLHNGVIVPEIKCPCGLRDNMEDADCDRTDCRECCPLMECEK